MTIPGMGEEDNPADNELTFLQRSGVQYIDKRGTGGSLWIIGGEELKEIVKKCESFGLKFKYMEHGGKATDKKPGWWAK